VAVESVVVEVDLRVERQKAAVFGDRQRVDLHKGAVLFEKEAVEVPDDFGKHLSLLRVQPQRGGKLSGLERADADDGMDCATDDLFRGGRRHLFDVHAAFRRGHKHNAFLSPRPVHDQAQVKFLPDGVGLFHQGPAHLFPLGAGLMGHQLHPEDRPGGMQRLVRRGGRPDAASFSPASRVDLRLDDGPALQLFRRVARRVRRGSRLAARNRDAVTAQQLLRLKFVDLHLFPPGLCRIGRLCDGAGLTLSPQRDPDGGGDFSHQVPRSASARDRGPGGSSRGNWRVSAFPGPS